MTEPQADTAAMKAGVQTRETDRVRNGDRAPIEETRSFGAPSIARGGELTRGDTPGGALFEPFLAVHLEMNRWFDELWRQAAGMGAPALRTARPFAGHGAASLFGLPPSDLKETEKAYLLSVELPGLTREDIDLRVKDDNLVITGQKGEEKEDASATYRFSERRFGQFARTFPIPSDVDPAKLSARFTDGLLKIELPKSGEAAREARRIEIR